MPKPVEKPAPRTPLIQTIDFKGEAHPFHLGVNGWVKAEEKFGLATLDIARELGGKQSIARLAFMIATGLSTDKMEWSIEEACDVIQEIGVPPALALVAADLNHIYGSPLI